MYGNKTHLKVRYFENNDFVLLTETWSLDPYDFNVNGFENIMWHRTANKHGSKRISHGLTVYIRSKFYDNNVIIKTHCHDIIWLGFNPGKYKYIR